MRILFAVWIGLIIVSIMYAADSLTKKSTSNFNDEVLSDFYMQNNFEYFDDKLPPNVSVRWVDMPKDEDGITPLGHTIFVPDNFRIEIDKKSNPTLSTAFSTLLHEECHIYDHVNKLAINDVHGPDFQKCMLGLAEKGAFKGIW